MKIVKILIALLLLFVVAFAVHVYMTEFYYKEPQYSFGTKNLSSIELREVTTKLLPKGEDLVGILSPGQAGYYMDPRWPIPTNVSVSFLDTSNQQHELNLKTGLTEQFRGKITMVITEDKSGYSLKLETVSGK